MYFRVVQPNVIGGLQKCALGQMANAHVDTDESDLANFANRNSTSTTNHNIRKCTSS